MHPPPQDDRDGYSYDQDDTDSASSQYLHAGDALLGLGLVGVCVALITHQCLGPQPTLIDGSSMVMTSSAIAFVGLGMRTVGLFAGDE
ncbi:MAG: hypothetical protein AAFS10_14820 [Myxococcota bacterium]